MTTPSKRPFTLVEVLVSSMLGVFLIAALVQLALFSKQKEKISYQVGSQAIAYLEVKERLAESLGLAEPLEEPLLQQESAEASGLYFTFENGIDIDPHFCGRCRARLWHAPGALFLTVFGREKKRTQELWRGEERIAFLLWDGKTKKPTESARIDRSVRAVIIDLGGREIICPLQGAPILEVL